MKTRTWVILLGIFCLLCVAAMLLLPCLTATGTTAEVYSDGVLVQTLDLSTPGEYTICNEYGSNVLRVDDGKVSVIEASCASQDCVHHGPANSGAPIVCLPNRLVVRFSSESALDAIVG